MFYGFCFFFVIRTSFFQVPNLVPVTYCYITNYHQTWKLKARSNSLYLIILWISNWSRAQLVHTSPLYNVQWCNLVVFNQCRGWSGESVWLHTYFWCLSRGRGGSAHLGFLNAAPISGLFSTEVSRYMDSLLSMSSGLTENLPRDKKSRWDLLRPWTRNELRYISIIFY